MPENASCTTAQLVGMASYSSQPCVARISCKKMAKGTLEEFAEVVHG